jgi:hypothetical protein
MWPFTRKRNPEVKRPTFARPPLRGTDTQSSTDTSNSFVTNLFSGADGLFGSSGAESGPTGSHHDCNTSAHDIHSIDSGSCGSSHDGGSNGGGFDGGGHSH